MCSSDLVFLEFDDEVPASQPLTSPLTVARDDQQGVRPYTDDPETPYEFYEIHFWRDFDEDGYKEPYIAYLRRDTGKIYRIVARYFEDSVEYSQDGRVIRIKPEQYFTKYGFTRNRFNAGFTYKKGKFTIQPSFLLESINKEGIWTTTTVLWINNKISF